MEYAAIYKNVVGLVCGMAKGLNYGDNFIAVVVANAIKELGVLLEVVGVPPRELANSSYSGDLLVTGYSAHSRNRSFGELIGIGYSVVDAQEKMSMIAEGYSATKGLYEIHTNCISICPFYIRHIGYCISICRSTPSLIY